jgi:peptidoglycan/xylan/chitin deacetylase (PgdA/CDA1 family)
MSGAVFLMYHELETAGRTLCEPEPGYVRYVVAAEDFGRQVSQLRSAGVRGLSVSEALSELDAPGNEAPRAGHSDDSKRNADAPKETATSNGAGGPRVVFTFDDGCETDLLFAAPTLKEAGFGATFYVTVTHLGRRGYLSEGQLRELADCGFEVGSHSLTHSYLHDLPDGRVRAEVSESKERLEHLTGRSVRHFSCPGGRWDARVARFAREAGYESLVTSRAGLNARGADRFRLSRVAVMRGMGDGEFARACGGEGLAALRARGAVLDAAKRVLGNSMYERLRSTVLGRGEAAG